MAASKSVASKGAGAPRDGVAGIDDDDGRFVSALARGLFILRAFEDASQTLANGELAQRTGLPKATITRLTHTLVALGYLESLPGEEKFRLGPAVLTLGATFLRGNSFPRIVTPYLQRLANQTGCHVALGVREGIDCVYVQLWRGAGQTIILSSGVGQRLPMARTAMGMAMLAAMPEPERGIVFAAMQSQRQFRGSRLAAMAGTLRAGNRESGLLRRDRAMAEGDQRRRRPSSRIRRLGLCGQHQRAGVSPR